MVLLFINYINIEILSFINWLKFLLILLYMTYQIYVNKNLYNISFSLLHYIYNNEILKFM